MGSQPAQMSRRSTFAVSLGVAAGAALLLPGCSRGEEQEVSATEDLMREHGVLRRLLVVYRETAPVLRASAASLDAAVLAQAADLFKTFGEDYHERQLEEQHVFPAVRAAGGQAAALIDTLLAQHKRSREITAFIKAKCAAGRVAAGDGEPLARALESFARMYEAHTSYEDTIVFQAWKQTMSPAQLHETGERFEDIERAQFHGDGFDMALDQVRHIEQRLGLHDLGRYTAPAPG
jgi:hemerythrin-like domain-containing protein